MGVRGTVDYTPSRVAKGLRDYVAWETRVPSKVEIYDMGSGGFEARVELPAAVKTRLPNIEQDLRELLPDGYQLKVTWTE